MINRTPLLWLAPNPHNIQEMTYAKNKHATLYKTR